MSSYFIFVMPPSFCDGGYVKGAGVGGGRGYIWLSCVIENGVYCFLCGLPCM